MSTKRPASIQAILQQRQQSEFVGRDGPLAFFRQNLGQAPDDPQHRFVLTVSGQGGVGKSTLLREFRQIATAAGARSGWTDQGESDLPAALTRLAHAIDPGPHTFGAFHERAKKLGELQHKLETEADRPQEVATFLGRTAGRILLREGRRVPLLGGVLDEVDADAFGTQVGEVTNYITRKLTNKDELRLVQAPDEVLTPLFLEGLARLGEPPAIVLFCDTYEQTGPYLDPWLRRLLAGDYGEVPGQVVVVVAGREALDRNLWDSYELAVARFPLEPFTEAEALGYLASKGVTDPQTTAVILRLSGRLPLLLAMLAEASPSDPDQVGDPSGPAVERFLMWERDPARRRLAVEAALPRRWNRDVLAVLTGETDADGLFGWLKGQPFVEEPAGGWTYHAVVRPQMLHYQYRESPARWAAVHEQLAAYYTQWQASLGLSAKQGRQDTAWQALTLEAAYHRLCAAPQKELRAALEGFVQACEAKWSFGRRWADMMEQAGEDSAQPEVQQWGVRLAVGAKAYEENHHAEAVAVFTELLDRTELADAGRSHVLAWRGISHVLLSQYAEALADFDLALMLDPEDAWVLAQRGETYQEMSRYPEALADLDRALALDPEAAWVLGARGETYRQMNRCLEALADFDRALTLDPEAAWILGSRGQTYRQMNRCLEALADFDRALTLAPQAPWVLGSRGQTHQTLKHYDAALADFDHALVLDPTLSWALGSRGETYLLLGRYLEALADFDRALTLNPDDAWARGRRGETYLLLGRYAEALADLDQAVALVPEDLDWVTRRGQLYLALGRYPEALRDLERALDAVHRMDPDTHWDVSVAELRYTYAVALVCRQGLPAAAEAIAAARAASQAERETDTAGAACYYLGGLAALIGLRENALADLAQALVLKPQVAVWARADPAWRELREDHRFVALVAGDEPAPPSRAPLPEA